MSERVTVQQAAKELGLAPQGVRVQMIRGELDIGRVVPSVSGNGRRYLIYRDKLNKELGKDAGENIKRETGE